MVRVVSDRVVGQDRVKPSLSTLYDASTVFPFCFSFDTTLASLANSTTRWTVPNDDMIYIIDMLSIGAGGYYWFSPSIYFSTNRYSFDTVKGWIVKSYRNHPYMPVTGGDTVDINIINRDVPVMTYYICINGCKIAKPIGWTHSPY